MRCAELKRRCYERGAEDNLSAVIVRVGEPAQIGTGYNEPTLENNAEVEELATQRAPRPMSGNYDLTEDPLVPASRIAFPAPADTTPVTAAHAAAESQVAPSPVAYSRREKSSSRAGTRFLVVLFMLVAVAGAFYAGARYRERLPASVRRTFETAPPVVVPTPLKVELLTPFEQMRRNVDRAPAAWLQDEMPKELARQEIKEAIASTNPEFLYLYGRALLLSGHSVEASKAFQRAIQLTVTPDAASIRKEATIGLAAATIESPTEKQLAVDRLHEVQTPAEAAPK